MVVVDGTSKDAGPTGSLKKPTLALLVSSVAVWAKRASGKLKPNKRHRNGDVVVPDEEEGESPRKLLPPKSPFVARPKQLLSQISNKLVHRHSKQRRAEAEEEEESDGDWGGGHVRGAREREDRAEEGSGIWQKGILMGDKCQPLDFSGVIYYDVNGRLLNHVPLRSPRASPLPAYLSRLP